MIRDCSSLGMCVVWAVACLTSGNVVAQSETPVDTQAPNEAVLAATPQSDNSAGGRAYSGDDDDDKPSGVPRSLPRLELLHPHQGSVAIPLLLIHGNRSEDDDESDLARWDALYFYVVNHPEDFARYDIYVWFHDTSLPIGFNCAPNSNAAQLQDEINTLLSSSYPPGSKVALLAHSRGGLVSRSYMQHADNINDVHGLLTLATPHHGTPLAVADYNAECFHWLSELLPWVGPPAARAMFNALFGAGKAFDPYRDGDMNLGWDNCDGKIQYRPAFDFDVDIASGGQMQLTPADCNQNSDTGYSDVTDYWGDLKSDYGTLEDLNDPNSATQDVRQRIVTYAAYDNNLGVWWELLGEVIGDLALLDDENIKLEVTTGLLAWMSIVIEGSANYYANDGLVPMQSALFLEISDGTVFASVDGESQKVVPDPNAIS